MLVVTLAALAASRASRVVAADEALRAGGVPVV